MWYAVQVRTGDEEKTKLLCNKLIPREILTECFVPYYEHMKRYLGSWHKTIEILFPGYIFMISDDKDVLRQKVKHIPGFLKILGDGREIIPLSGEEIEFLRNFGGGNHRISMSQGFIENNKVIITDGPMKSFMGDIKKIDRHKRIAIIKVDFFGRSMDVRIGLEILERVDDDICRKTVL